MGQGRGRRIDGHEYEARQGHQCSKCAIIREIWVRGEQVVKRKVREMLTHQQALLGERETAANCDPNSLVNEKTLLSVHPTIHYLPKTLSLSVTLRNKIAPFVEAKMRDAGIDMSKKNCEEYLRFICEQALLEMIKESTDGEC